MQINYVLTKFIHDVNNNYAITVTISSETSYPERP